MRVYDPRLGKFLSVDPLTKNFAFYSPYHFAGNNPVENQDLDGGEPQDFKDNWITKPLFNLSSKEKVGDQDWTVRVTDPKLGLVDARLVYDKWTKTTWFVTEQDDQNYYLKNDNGNPSEMTIHTKGDVNNITKGIFEKFNTQDQVQAKYAAVSADLLGKATFAIFAIGAAAPAAAEMGLLSLGNAPISARLGNSVADLGAQLTFNGFDFKKVNWSSTIANGLFASPFTSAAVGSAFQYSYEDYKKGKNNTIFGKKTLGEFAFETAIGTAGNWAGGKANERIPNLFGLGNIRIARFASNLYWNYHANFFSAGVQSSLSEPVPSDDSKKNENE